MLAPGTGNQPRLYFITKRFRTQPTNNLGHICLKLGCMLDRVDQVSSVLFFLVSDWVWVQIVPGLSHSRSVWSPMSELKVLGSACSVNLVLFFLVWDHSSMGSYCPRFESFWVTGPSKALDLKLLQVVLGHQHSGFKSDGFGYQANRVQDSSYFNLENKN